MKGLWILIALIVVGVLGCVVLPFMVMPGAGIGAALPVIYVPGEPLSMFDALPFDVTNTLVAAVVTSLFVMAWILPIAANLKPVPGRAQAFVEMLVETWDNLARSAAGAKGRQLVPFALSVFFFLLVANVMKIIPGVDTIGELHCAGIHQGDNFVSFNGYPVHGDSYDDFVNILKVERIEGKTVNTGEKIDEELYEICHHYMEDGVIEVHHGEEGDHAEGADADHAEEGDEEHTEDAAVATTDEGGDDGADSVEDEGDESEPTEGGNVEGDTETAEDVDGGPEVAEGDLSAEHEEEITAADFRYVVTPFLRGASTDLALTFAIALVAMVLVQYYGIKELGALGYGAKFINLPALARGGMGFMDFAVGILETFLEFAKVVSFAFRLFGAMFGGQVLMFVIVFLVSMLIPVIVIGLEVFIGAIQAFVFAILFLMFASVAMTSHSHDDEHHHEEAEAHH